MIKMYLSKPQFIFVMGNRSRSLPGDKMSSPQMRQHHPVDMGADRTDAQNGTKKTGQKLKEPIRQHDQAKGREEPKQNIPGQSHQYPVRVLRIRHLNINFKICLPIITKLGQA